MLTPFFDLTMYLLKLQILKYTSRNQDHIFKYLKYYPNRLPM